MHLGCSGSMALNCAYKQAKKMHILFLNNINSIVITELKNFRVVFA